MIIAGHGVRDSLLAAYRPIGFNHFFVWEGENEDIHILCLDL
jgi:hypothetical protein